jgi:two-component system sensor histidine kinase PilS (NtrC family)
MAKTWAADSWPERALDAGSKVNPDSSQELNRLWLGFMTTRVMLGILLVILQFVLLYPGSDRSSLLLAICAAYFVATLSMRLLATPGRLGHVLDGRWIGTVGLDILIFSALQLAQGSSINYSPLFALPILMASVLGSLLLAMGAAAAATLFLLGQALWLVAQAPWDLAAQFMQAALTGTGCFSIAFLANQIATRLTRQETKAERSQLAAKAQALVNTLVIESMSDGILVIDSQDTIKAANPAALDLLGRPNQQAAPEAYPATIHEWPALVKLANETFTKNEGKVADVTIEQAGKATRKIQVRTQITATQTTNAERLCVMFLKDQREIEARMRKDKLASMARMSVAVAHEIRNPLAAITQANALLAEDILDPRHQQLIQMINQNAHRLGKIVDEVLNVTRLPSTRPSRSFNLPLGQAVQNIHQEWTAQSPRDPPALLNLSCGDDDVFFDSEHLRQVLVNLLDNARRYASPAHSSIQIHAEHDATGRTTLSVWSNGSPMDQSMETHLFEPFFSSESRSSGLGLYICRELCEGHGAAIGYSRETRLLHGVRTEGNEFTVTFRSLPRMIKLPLKPDAQRSTQWQPARH